MRGRIEAILTYATVKGYRRSNENPARWTANLKEVLPMPSKIQKTAHMPAVQIVDLSSWFKALQSREGISAKALEFLTLTAVRSGEVHSGVRLIWYLKFGRSLQKE